jgi:hypothetical protein
METLEKVMSPMLAAFCIYMAVFLLLCSVFSSGRITYCYVDADSPGLGFGHGFGKTHYSLIGHREWRPDRTMADNLGSPDEVKKVAKLYGCPIR